jgi:hypothetical protein
MYSTQQANSIRRMVTVLSAFTLLGGCCNIDCENEVAARVASPSGKRNAVVFHRGCGATTGFNTQVSVLKATDPLPNEGGNVLIVDDEVPLNVQWDSEGSLSISGLGSGRIFRQEHFVSGVTVAYK